MCTRLIVETIGWYVYLMVNASAPVIRIDKGMLQGSGKPTSMHKGPIPYQVQVPCHSMRPSGTRTIVTVQSCEGMI